MHQKMWRCRISMLHIISIDEHKELHYIIDWNAIRSKLIKIFVIHKMVWHGIPIVIWFFPFVSQRFFSFMCISISVSVFDWSFRHFWDANNNIELNGCGSILSGWDLIHCTLSRERCIVKRQSAREKANMKNASQREIPAYFVEAF